MIKIKKPQKKIKTDDDGRTIAPMNVPGMPWHDRHRPHRPGKKQPWQPDQDEQSSVPPLSGKETRRLILQAVFTALVIGFIFLTAIFLFILFSLKVWLK